MKQYLIYTSLILMLVFSAAAPVYASPIRSNGMSLHNDSSNDMNLTEPDIVFDGRDTSRNIYGRYDQIPELTYGNGHIPSAPVPEPLSLVLFGMGMIGIGFLAKKNTI